MKINNVFRDEIAEIREVIKSIPVEGCVRKYDDYIESISETSGLEREFVQALNNNKVKFAMSLKKEKLAKLSKEDMLEELLLYIQDGCYEMSNRCYDDPMDDIIHEMFTDKEAHPYIVKELNETLDKLVADMNKTKLEQERQAILERIQSTKDSIKYTEDNLVKYKENLAGLEKQLKALDEQ